MMFFTDRACDECGREIAENERVDNDDTCTQFCSKDCHDAWHLPLLEGEG